jgi:hypothetical protein
VSERDQSFVIRVAITTLAFVIVSSNVVLLIGLWSPDVSNAEIFKIVTPEISTVVGAMTGLVSGLLMGRKPPQDTPAEPPPAVTPAPAQPTATPAEEQQSVHA